VTPRGLAVYSAEISIKINRQTLKHKCFILGSSIRSIDGLITKQEKHPAIIPMHKPKEFNNENK
jgi:hypothetical protein